MSTSEILPNELLLAALTNLALAAAPFRHGRGMTKQRAVLNDALLVMRPAFSMASFEKIDTDWEGLRAMIRSEHPELDTRGLLEMANEADQEAREKPNFREDLDG